MGGVVSPLPFQDDSWAERDAQKLLVADAALPTFLAGRKFRV